ncbi:MAG TPA: YggT family protein [Anaerolineales bacterium]|nr:YggT family protein [Anaerolineales bacterium]
MSGLIGMVQLVATVLSLVVLVDVVLSYFLPPYHPVKQALDSVVEPMLAPIRRLLPSVGMFDFSPVVLIILIQVVESVLIQILRTG